jgi:arylsulfatase A-like enzyme/Flp pilus assembly protein TadD
VLLLAVLAVSAPAAARPERAAEKPPAPAAVVLLTLDTTRADYLGCYGGAATPALDGLAARGVLWLDALTPSPLTLPAHASLLTGLEPPEHGLRDNGVAVLGVSVPTVATVLADRGWDTAAFVASRVLDRRFGLDRGFDVYDDRMAAEVLGEYGYPERDAEAVTDAALAWLAERAPAVRSRGDATAAAKAKAVPPFFLWVHYYDPHAPYRPPAPAGSSDEARYRGEIAYMDAQIGRLLAALPEDALIAAVADHGEALGEHGERAHGIFLYQASLHVPLIVAGPGEPKGAEVPGTVSARRLAPTLLRLAGALPPEGMAPPLPGLAGPGEPPPAEAVYSETLMPLSAYGWSPLEALTDGDWRVIVAPRPELYDLGADPGESANRIDDRRPVARRLRDELAARKEGFAARPAAPAPPDPELEAALRSLGYAAGGRAAGERGDGIDPKDGIALLDELARAKELLAAGRAAESAAMLEKLVERNPSNVPLWTNLGGALGAAGRGEAALAAYRRAVELNPGLDFLHLNLAEALWRLGRADEARREYELALEINPRAASAWLTLAEMAARRGAAAEERRLLGEAVAAGTASAGILARLGQIEMEAGDTASAARRFAEATELAPGWAMLWVLRAQLHLRDGEPAKARPFLERAVALDPAGPAGAQARRWLGGLAADPPGGG